MRSHVQVSDLMKDDDRRDDPEEESKEQLKVATDGSGNGSEDVEKVRALAKLASPTVSYGLENIQFLTFS